ncbi:MAG: hypothetical protein SGPRY_000979 [Prymnesium sp.]
MGDLAIPLQWELQQLELLHDLAQRPEYNWKPNSKAFKKRVKLIQHQSLARQTAAVHGGSSQDVRKGAPTRGRAGCKQARKTARMGALRTGQGQEVLRLHGRLDHAREGSTRGVAQRPRRTLNWRRFISTRSQEWRTRICEQEEDDEEEAGEEEGEGEGDDEPDENESECIGEEDAEDQEEPKKRTRRWK